MNSEAIFLTEISKLKRRSSIRFVNRTLLWGAVFFLSSYTILNIMAKATFSGPDPNRLWVIILIGVSLIAAIAVALIERKDFQAFLIDIDTRLQLQDSISTAFEYHRTGNKSVFIDLLMQEATAKLSRLNPDQIFPAKFSGLHVVLMLALIAAGASFFSHYSGLLFTSASVDQRKIEKAMTLVREFARGRVAIRSSEEAKDNSALDSNIRKLRNTLNSPTITSDELFTTLNKQLKEIQSEQTLVAAELAARLEDARLQSTPIEDFPDLENFDTSQMATLKRILNQTFNNGIPDDVHQDLESLQELLSMEELLSMILDDFHEGDSGPEAIAESEHRQSSGSSYPGESRQKDGDPDHPPTAGDIAGEKEGRGMDIPGRSRSENSQADNFDMQNESGLYPGTSPRAGNAKSGDGEKQDSEIEKAPGPGVQDKVTSARVKQYLVRIRSQTSPGESRLKEEEIVREYKQEVEGILQKEDIPLNYREYIKNYFLSIGIETAESIP